MCREKGEEVGSTQGQSTEEEEREIRKSCGLWLDCVEDWWRLMNAAQRYALTVLTLATALRFGITVELNLEAWGIGIKGLSGEESTQILRAVTGLAVGLMLRDGLDLAGRRKGMELALQGLGKTVWVYGSRQQITAYRRAKEELANRPGNKAYLLILFGLCGYALESIIRTL